MTIRWSTRTKKVAVGAGVLLASLGIGGTAFAATGSTTGSTSGQTPSTTTKAHHPKLRALLRHSVVDTRVVKTKTGYVTIESIKGTVNAVDPTSITVVAANGTQVTATIGANTRFVRVTQAALATGDKVGLVEVGSAARLIVGPKAAVTPTS
jgi:hypothetical protein